MPWLTIAEKRSHTALLTLRMTVSQLCTEIVVAGNHVMPARQKYVLSEHLSVGIVLREARACCTLSRRLSECVWTKTECRVRGNKITRTQQAGEYYATFMQFLSIPTEQNVATGKQYIRVHFAEFYCARLQDQISFLKGSGTSQRFPYV